MLRRPDLMRYIEKLDPTHPIGIRGGRGLASATGSKAQTVKCFQDFLKWKREYPRAVLLVRVSGGVG